VEYSERVIVFAPAGRDAEVARAVLDATGLATEICSGLAALLDEVKRGVGAVLLTDEALFEGDVQPLASWLRRQPPWSDLPFIVLTRQGSTAERNPAAERLTGALANVSFLERPFHATTLISMVRAALRARRRQYQARDAVLSAQRAEESLRLALEARLRGEAEREQLLAALSSERAELERRVVERTADLAAANGELRRQIDAKEHAEGLLRQSQKLETMGQLVGGVAHDFNNLLMVILSSLELLQRRLAGDAAAARLIESARRGAERGSSLTKRLLAFARRQDLEPERVDLVEAVASLRDLIGRSVGPQIRLSVRHEPGVPAVMVDRNQLEMALLNLVVNARDAMNRTGTITITIQREQGTEQDDNAVGPGDYVSLAVADNGVGMDEATLRRAIEPFFSTKGVGKGTGLGLSMVHGMAKQSGGTLTLKSRPGEGTVASIWLPTAEHAPVAAEPVRHPVPVSGTASGLVLMVDDDELVAAGTAAMLEDLGYTVIVKHSGQEALDALRHGEEPLLLLTDQAMPTMTGLELAGHVRAFRPNLPILVATGFADFEGDDMHGLPKLLKPFRQDQLASEISRLVRRS
jgi:signal transduction histidine kinase